jgi:cytochrome P450
MGDCTTERTVVSTNSPRFDLDLYTDAAIADPYPIYRKIRDLGPAVWLTAHDAWAIGRFADVRAALRADDVLISGHGVAMNTVVNGQPSSRITLTSDGDVHRQLRAVLMKPMMPSVLHAVEERVQSLADELVADLLGRDSFDGMTEFAQYLPVAIVSHLVGLPEQGRQRMLDWARATFDALGTMNDRAEAGLPFLFEMASYAAGVKRESLRPGGWAAMLFAAADEKRIEPTDVASMLIDYIAPSLDTTILGVGHLLYQLGRSPEQWEMIRRDHELISRAIDETLRLEAPVRAFSRYAAADYNVDGTTIPTGSRVLILFASGNRDERHYKDADRFDITRDARDHLGFGHGVHRCAGSHVAQLEMTSLLRAMVTRVERINVSAPVLGTNNVLYGYRSFLASFR